MQILRSIEELSQLQGPVALAIGVFDGVHRGHQEVIRAAQEYAAQHSGTAVVLTFEPHPLKVLRPDQAPRLLCSLNHKLAMLSRLGITHSVVHPFDSAFASTPAEEFIEKLASSCRPLGFISVGYTWRFGKGGEGDIHLLMDAGERLGFGVYGVPAVHVDGFPVSSTAIRDALTAGDLSQARLLLGRDASVLGRVVLGRQLGRTIGFPTANVETGAEQLPPPGVYAVRALIQGIEKPGVANLGHRPTVAESEAPLKLEVHLFDLDGDLYGQDVEVSFVHRIRDERKFENLDELKAQIARDSNQAREVLAKS